jgi:hypothetical protein
MSLRAVFAKQSPAKQANLIEETFPLNRGLLRREERPPRNDMTLLFLSP